MQVVRSMMVGMNPNAPVGPGGPLLDDFPINRFDPPWTEPTGEQTSRLRDDVEEAAIALARRISPRGAHIRCITGSSPDLADALRAVAGTADWNLAVLRALRQIVAETGHLADQYAGRAGRTGATYPALGTAWDISRQAARKRWPGVVSSNPNTNRAPEAVTLTVFGGEARVSFLPENGGWWWIATSATSVTAEAPEDTTYDSREEAAAVAGAFLAANQ